MWHTTEIPGRHRNHNAHTSISPQNWYSHFKVPFSSEIDSSAESRILADHDIDCVFHFVNNEETDDNILHKPITVDDNSLCDK